MRKNSSPERRYFVRRHRRRINIILMLAMINLFTAIMSGGDFTPWFLFPAFFIALPMIQDFVNFLLGGQDDEEVYEEEAEYEKEMVEEIMPRSEARPVSTYSTHRQSDLANPAIQAHLDKARTYREQIEALIQATSDQHSRSRLKDLSIQINEWTQAVEAMAQRIDSFQQNPVIHQDLETVPQAIEKLEAQLANEIDETIRAELERTLANRKKQLAILERLQNTMRQAEIKIESTLASLGTIYSQLLTSQSTNHVADYSRLSAEVNEEVRTLQDHLEALEEVKLGRV
jgi:hypothetical protein